MSYKLNIKPFFHLQDPISNDAMMKGIEIGMCQEFIPNSPNHIEINEKVILSGRLVNDYPRNDSYCGIRSRKWKYGTGTGGGKKEYDGDAWTTVVSEFMDQSDTRRCPFCESIYLQIPLESVLEKRIKN